MTKQRCIELLIRRAVQVADANRLDAETGGMFCGIPTAGEIFIYGPHFAKVIDALQPTVTYNPTIHQNYVEAEFTMELLGKKCRVYSLLDRGGKRQ